MSSSQLPEEQKAKLHEVADLLLDIYTTLAKMHYISRDNIIRGPHTIPSVPDIYLDPSITYLYSILPYISGSDAERQGAFFGGGDFADFRDSRTIIRGRDPFYREPEVGFEEEGNGEYILPWMTPLSEVSHGNSILIYDARRHRIWCLDQGWMSTDPALRPGYGEAGSDWGDDSGEDYEDGEEDEEDGMSEGSSEFWSDEVSSAEGTIEPEILSTGEQRDDEEAGYDEGFEVIAQGEVQEAETATRSKNENSLDNIKNRPAGEFLRDLVRWYRELKEVPGQEEYGNAEWYEPEVLRELLSKAGWPDEFDGDAFDVGRTRALFARRAKDLAEKPLRDVESREEDLKNVEEDLETRRQDLDAAENEDEKWDLRFDIWSIERNRIKSEKALEKAREKANLCCPGGTCQSEEDLPLWEMAMLRAEVEEQGRVQVLEEFEQPRGGQTQATIYKKAYEASREDAKRLCPGRESDDVPAIKILLGRRRDTESEIAETKGWIENTLIEIEGLSEWAVQLPEDAPTKIRNRVIELIERNEEFLEARRMTLIKQEQALAERGNVLESGRKATGGMAPRRATGGVAPKKRTGGSVPTR